MVKQVIIEREGFECYRCGHQWVPNDIGKPPAVCPTCKSPYWNRPRRDAQPPQEGGGTGADGS